jgi:hypothetical protein
MRYSQSIQVGGWRCGRPFIAEAERLLTINAGLRDGGAGEPIVYSMKFLASLRRIPVCSLISTIRRRSMKLRIAAIAILCIGLFCTFQSINTPVYAQNAKLTVLSPVGTPPPVTVKPMAEPLSTLDGKTIYLVNTSFPGTERLMAEFKTWFQTNHPKTTIVDQRTGMSNLTPALKKELQEKADAVIFALGH